MSICRVPCAQIFETDSEDVQREWVRYTQKVDKKMEEALRHTIKRSLQELSRLLNGDNKTEVQPIFHVTMVLERSNKVELQPTIQSLFDMVHRVSRNLITVIQAVPRVALQLTEKQRRDMEEANMVLPKPLPSLYEIISSDEEAVLRTIMQITQGITSIVDKVQKWVRGWSFCAGGRLGKAGWEAVSCHLCRWMMGHGLGPGHGAWPMWRAR